MSALNAKPSSSLNGIKYISRSILAILELQNVRNAEEKDFVREKISGIFLSTHLKKFRKHQLSEFFIQANEGGLACIQCVPRIACNYDGVAYGITRCACISLRTYDIHAFA